MSKKKQQEGIPLETLFRDSGFIRNFKMFVKSNKDSNGLEDAIFEELVNNANSNVEKKEVLKKSSARGGASTAEKYKSGDQNTIKQKILIEYKKLLDEGCPSKEISAKIEQRTRASRQHINRVRREFDKKTEPKP